MPEGTFSKQGDAIFKRTDGSLVNLADTLQKMKDGNNGAPGWAYDATPNSSVRTITVPAGKLWQILHIHGEIVCTATVGSRVLFVQILNGSAQVVWAAQKSAVIAASQKGVVNLSPSLPAGTTAANAPMLDGTSPNIAVYNPIPSFMLPAGYQIKIWDSASIDAAADDMITSVHYIEYNAEDFQ